MITQDTGFWIKEKSMVDPLTLYILDLEKKNKELISLKNSISNIKQYLKDE